MPYSIPSPTSSTLTMSAPAPATAAVDAMRPIHRRARSAGLFSDERGPGAFASLGALPRRHPKQTTPTTQAPPSANNRKQPVFRISVDEDDSDSTNESDHDHNENSASPLTSPRSPRPSPGLHISTIPLTLQANNRDNAKVVDNDNNDTLAPPQSIPFPRTSPLSPPITGPTSPPPQVRASGSITRSGSHPVVLLANGKPLKSSLKSSSSAPHISTPASHMRAQSAPSTPSAFVIKNVHFAEKGLEDIRLFSRSAKPLSVSSPAAADATETETETENDYFTFGSGSIVGSSGRNAFPFPKAPAATTAVTSATSASSSSGANPASSSSPAPTALELDPTQSSIVPSTTTSPHAHVVLESLVFHTPTLQQQELRGTLLLRNVAFEKHALVRFTLDGWQTTSEVSARYVASLPALPAAVLGGGNAGAGGARTMGDAAANFGMGYDRFAFTINLADYGSRLADRTLFCAAMYKAAGSEWWDNNAGANYRVGFRRSSASASTKATSAPSASAPGVERKIVGFSQSAPSTPAASMYAPTLPIPSAASIVALPPIRNVNRPVLTGLKTTGMAGAPAAPSSGGSTPPSGPSSPIVSPLATRKPKLSLLNYVAPAASPVVTKPSSADTTPNADNSSLSVPPKDQQPLTPPMTPERELRALPFTGTGSGASPIPSPTHSPTRVFTDIGSNTEDVPTPTGRPGSPVSRTSPGVHWPWGTSAPALARPMMSFGAGVGGGGSNDALYQAMVREWCFAQSPVPTPPEQQPSPSPSHGVIGVGLAH